MSMPGPSVDTKAGNGKAIIRLVPEVQPVDKTGRHTEKHTCNNIQECIRRPQSELEYIDVVRTRKMHGYCFEERRSLGATGQEIGQGIHSVVEAVSEESDRIRRSWP